MVTPPATAAASSNAVFTSAMWDTGPAALNSWMSDPPRVMLAQTVAQSIQDNANTAVAFDQVVYDNYQGRNAAGDTWYAPAAGVYLVSAVSNLAWTGAAGAFIGNTVAVVGKATWAAYEIPSTPSPVRFQLCLNALIPMVAGDGVQLRIYQNSGAAQPTGFITTGCRMSARWIGQ
ncbi:hypothetical protein KGQ20_02175 [Catenulispora sp. NF23]|uniref:C1q domain-containing protein n=1 Tax=Catenulispora pinistramenti TaxID=2705254 RepID=A0ABS5KJ63_9ACTN|nr:hypothetical protein [Catenulispora pinistramenti]MBS2531572.1 hypothetical protein [Catenulispora pinistramenti]MBS2546178.1 hypothetical protein [Catenulispora pinistramenti]